MTKNILLTLGAAVIIAGGLFYAFQSSPQVIEPATGTVVDYKNASYVIDGKTITLTNGVSEVAAAPGSASKVVTRFFGNEVKADLDKDGREDVVFLLTQDQGGSGTFYYVVAALNKVTGYVGSQGLLLGDRIAPQSTEKGRGDIVIVNYAERSPGEDFGVAPSVGRSIWIILDPTTMQFGQVVPDFEGEVDPSKMSLDMKTWTWISVLYTDGTQVFPKKATAFTLSLEDNGTFSAKTDCNSLGGTYTLSGKSIAFSKMVSTLMFCEGSQEDTFSKLLSDTSSYNFTSKGEMIFSLKQDSGTVIFR